MFAIHRVEKRKKSAVFGLQIEANRTQADHEKGRDFASSSIDWERTKDNQYAKGLHCENWSEGISQELKKAGITKAPKSNAVVLLDGLYTASPEWFEGKSKAEIIDFFKDCLKFHIQHYGIPLNAVIHWDEKSPHLSAVSVPILESSQGAKLCAKEIMGGRADYRARQDQFFEQVAKSRGFERGERSDPKHKKKHLSVQEYKKQQNEAQISAQERLLSSGKAEYDQLQKELTESLTELSTVKQELATIQQEKENLLKFKELLTKETFPEVEKALLQEFVNTHSVNSNKGYKKPIRDFYEDFVQGKFINFAQDFPEANELLNNFKSYRDNNEIPVHDINEIEWER